MPSTNKLTDQRCRSARAGDRPRKLFDGEGLFLFVSPTGAKVWRLQYRRAGKQQTMTLGPYPRITLAQARERRESAKRDMANGIDPSAAKKAAAGRGMTLDEAAAAYWNGRQDVTDGYRANALRAIP